MTMSRKLGRLQNNRMAARRCRLAFIALSASVFSMIGPIPLVVSAPLVDSRGAVSHAAGNVKNSSEVYENRPVVVKKLSASKIQDVPSSVKSTEININELINKISHLLLLAIVLLIILAAVITVIVVALYSFKTNMYKLKKTLSKLRVKHLLTQASLNQSERLIQGILTNTSDGIIIFDSQGAIESVNRAAEKIFQYRSEELRGRRLSVLLSGPEASDYDRYLGDGTGEGQGKAIAAGPQEVTGRRSDGMAMQMAISIKELYLGEGRQFIAIIQNVTRDGTKEFASKEGFEPRETATANIGYRGAFEVSGACDTSQQEAMPAPTALPRTAGILFPSDRPRQPRERPNKTDESTHADSFEEFRISK